MEYEELLYVDNRKVRQLWLTMNMVAFQLSQKELTLGEALEMCRRMGDFTRELLPEHQQYFEAFFAPQLRRLIHRFYD